LYVQSRQENLVTNGNGLLGDNTNFSEFEFDPVQNVSGGGSFKTDRQNGTIMSDELIPVTPTNKYRFSLMAKSKTGLGKNYFGITSYDIDGSKITPYEYYGSKHGIYELTQDLQKGDTIIYLSDVSEFRDDQDVPNHLHSLVLWGYKNNKGYEYEAGTYSKYTVTISWDKGAIDRENNTINLYNPFNLVNKSDAEGIFRKGHEVSPTISGGSYQYMPASNVFVNNEKWEQFEGTIKGYGIGPNIFPYGTAYVRLLFLTNRASSGGTEGDTL